MRLVPLIVLLAANLLANQVLAEDTSTQPLTRIDCDKSGMAWNDTANVCGAHAQVDVLPEKSNVADSVTQPLTRTDCDANNLTWNETANVCGGVPQVAEAAPDAQGVPTEVVDTSGQPLTRADCDKAGMLWNDTANVCEAAHAAERKSETQDLVNPNALQETAPITSTVLISIDKASVAIVMRFLQAQSIPVEAVDRSFCSRENVLECTEEVRGRCVRLTQIKIHIPEVVGAVAIDPPQEPHHSPLFTDPSNICL